MIELQRTIGIRVRQLRLDRGLTQEQLGERAGLSYKFVGEVERGVANPTVESLSGIARALAVAVPDLFVSLDRAGSGRAVELSEKDYSMVREALDSLEDVLVRRAAGRSRPRRPRSLR